MKNFLIALLLFPLLYAEEHLTIRLLLEKELHPLTCVHTAKTAYEKQLEEIIIFDWNHNGTTIFTPSPQASFIIRPQWKEKEAILEISTQGRTFFSGSIPITGDLSVDRKALHLANDHLYHTLFGKEGIASTTILFSQKTGEKTSEIFMADYDGGNPHPVTSEKTLSVTPTIVPGTTYFLFTAYQHGQPKIFLGNTLTKNSKPILPMRGNQLMPSMSKDNTQIAFISDVAGNPDLFLQSFDPKKGPIGKPRQIFSAHLATQGSPSFSPDGKKITFVSNKSGSPRIFILDIPPSGVPLNHIKPKLISMTTGSATSPSWSPDGKKIAFSAFQQKTRQIFVYDLEQEREIQITEGPLHKENPTWAPNSLHLIYNTHAMHGGDLYLIHLYDRRPLKLSMPKAERRFPAWQR